jgi:hypothetical protein
MKSKIDRFSIGVCAALLLVTLIAATYKSLTIDAAGWVTNAETANFARLKASTLLYAQAIAEYTADAGVDVDGVTMKDGSVSATGDITAVAFHGDGAALTNVGGGFAAPVDASGLIDGAGVFTLTTGERIYKWSGTTGTNLRQIIGGDIGDRVTLYSPANSPPNFLNIIDVYPITGNIHCPDAIDRQIEAGESASFVKVGANEWRMTETTDLNSFLTTYSYVTDGSTLSSGLSGPTPVAYNDYATKAFAESLVSGSLVFYSHDESSSDIAGYHQLTTLPDTGTYTTLSYVNPASGSYLTKWATEPALPAKTMLYAGTYKCTFRARVTSTGGNHQLKAEIYLRNTGGTEYYEIDTAELTPVLTNVMTSYTLAIVLSNSVAMDIGDRLVVKLKDTNTSNKTVEIEFAGTNYSRLETPLSSVPNLVDISCVSVSASGDVTATDFHGYFDPPILHVREELAKNTAGGTFTKDAWRTRGLNEVKTNAITGASLAVTPTNQITLPAGTYWCDITAPAFSVNGHQAKLQSISGTSTTILGTTEYSTYYGSGTPYANTRSRICGRFVLAAETVLEVQHYCVATYINQGFGQAANCSTEVYTEAVFTKLK